MNNKKKISFSYVDDENEKVILSSQDELKEAIRVLDSMKLLNKVSQTQASTIRFEVLKKISKFDKLNDSDSEEEEENTNPGEHRNSKIPSPLNQVEHRGNIYIYNFIIS
jgi:hypothetical protein